MARHASGFDEPEVSKIHQDERIEYDGGDDVPAYSERLQPPESILNMTAEQRFVQERKLVRKIDWRLLPMIIL